MGLRDLAAEVRAARGRLTLPEIEAAGGPSQNTVSRISRFDPTRQAPWPVHHSTLRALDVGLGWPEGRAQQLYEQLEERPGVIVTDADELADIVAERVVELLAARLAAGIS